jgi:hypothetical protein
MVALGSRLHTIAPAVKTKKGLGVAEALMFGRYTY